jgi:uncharacterized protein (DUF362 family)
MNGIPFVAVSSGTDKAALVRSAVELAGGMSAYVRPGNNVVIKPNAAWSRTPEEGANVHPDVLRSAIQLCFESGASSVSVVEYTCDNPVSALKVNGIQEAVAGTKASLRILKEGKDFVKVPVPRGVRLKSVEVSRAIQDADVFINMPIAKTHGSATLTLGMKNHMGAIQNRWFFHANDLHQCIADVSTVLRPQLIIVDATRLMLTNGPKGPGEVREENKVIVGTDQVAVDAYAATLFGHEGRNIGYIAKAYELGLGEIDLSRVDVRHAAA